MQRFDLIYGSASVLSFADNLYLTLFPEKCFDALAEQCVVVADDDANRCPHWRSSLL
jgi:hypothetical protein